MGFPNPDKFDPNLKNIKTGLLPDFVVLGPIFPVSHPDVNSKNWQQHYIQQTQILCRPHCKPKGTRFSTLRSKSPQSAME
jgi:hypothetical protein